jgi:two-component system cell cycle response regulator
VRIGAKARGELAMFENKSPNKIKVLIVDDSRVVRIAATRMFDDDFEVLQAVDGADGLAIIERNPDIHIVFTDLAMPEMDGFELLEAIRAHANDSISNLPVIVATGASNPDSAKQKAFSMGATDFVTKPFNATDLKTRVRSYANFRKENQTLKEHSTIDELTGLLNARGLQMQLEKELSFAGRHESNLTLLAIEIDNYKDFFVRIGRKGTEKVVSRTASVLLDAFRKEDSVARIGLARFMVTMPMSLSDNAIDMANRICLIIESFKAKLDGKRIKITVSIGVSSVAVDDDVNVSTVIGLSNESLNKANARGASQIFEMTLEDYRRQLDEETKQTMSIDKLLDQINGGDPLAIASQLDFAIERLSPFFRLLSNQQAEKIITSRQKHGDNVVRFDASRSSKKSEGL